MLACGFVLSPVSPGKLYNHAPLLPGDIQQLQKLFPENSIWNGRTTSSRHAFVFYPTTEQAFAFYRALVEYAQLEEPSGELYPAGGSLALGVWHRSLESLFSILIPFFEKELGFSGLR